MEFGNPIGQANRPHPLHQLQLMNGEVTLIVIVLVQLGGLEPPTS
jgi:hypothetical protein